jgi:hypothetical protein
MLLYDSDVDAAITVGDSMAIKLLRPVVYTYRWTNTAKEKNNGL